MIAKLIGRLHRGFLKLVPLFVGIALLATINPIFGQRETKGGTSSSHQLEITAATIQAEGSQMRISGRNFGNKAAPRAFLGLEGGGFVELSTAFVSENETIASYPFFNLVPGTYLLIVRSGPGSPRIDEMDITIGAVGPQGPQGIPGNLALAGMRCPEGESIIGFDDEGMIICGGGGGPAEGCTTLSTNYTIEATFRPPDPQEWPGGTVLLGSGDCTVTLGLPNGEIDDEAGDTWRIVAFTGYTSCAVRAAADPMCGATGASASTLGNQRPFCSVATTNRDDVTSFATATVNCGAGT